MYLLLPPTSFSLNKYEKLGKNISVFSAWTFQQKNGTRYESTGKLIMVKKKKKKKAQEAGQLNIYSHKIPKQVASTCQRYPSIQQHGPGMAGRRLFWWKDTPRGNTMKGNELQSQETSTTSKGVCVRISRCRKDSFLCDSWRNKDG